MSFEFSDRSRTITIIGKDYTYRLGDAETSKQIEAVANKIDRLKKAPKSSYYSSLQEAGKVIFEFIDTMLGDGSSAEIFADRPLNDRDLFEFMAWFIDEVRDDEQDKELMARIEEYTTYEPTRP